MTFLDNLLARAGGSGAKGRDGVVHNYAAGVMPVLGAKVADSGVDIGRIDAREYGADPTGSIDSRAALAFADAAAAGQNRHLVITGAMKVASNLTLASHVQFSPGATLVPQSGVTITHTGPVQAHSTSYCWNVSAGGRVVLTPGTIDRVTPYMFGAKGDGATDDTAALQAMFDATKPVSWDAAVYEPITRLEVPAGVFNVTSPLQMYGKQRLIGHGHGAHLNAVGAFPTGRGIIESSILGQTPLGTPAWPGGSTEGIWGFSEIRELSFSSSIADVWMFKAGPRLITGSCYFTDLHQKCPRGLRLGYYTQSCVIRNIYALGTVEQVLHLEGNLNTVDMIDKEGSVGTSTDAFIAVAAPTGGLASNSTDNVFRNCLVEGATITNKPAFKLSGTANTLIDYPWIEMSGATLAFDIEDSVGVQINHRVSWNEAAKVLIRNSVVTIDYMDATSGPTDFPKVFNTDDTSIIKIGRVLLPELSNVDAYPANIVVDEFLGSYYTLHSHAGSGFSAVVKPHRAIVENLLQNPSFELGLLGWDEGGVATSTNTFPTSTVAPGKMIRMAMTGSSGSKSLSQTFTISADRVGKPLTLNCMTRISSTVSAVWAVVSGCGITTSTHAGLLSDTGDWQRLSVTFTPLSAGSIQLGLVCQPVDTSTVWDVDDCCLSEGLESIIFPGRMQELNLGGVSHFQTASIPTITNAALGSVGWRNPPAVGQPIAWSWDGTAWRPWANL